MTLSQNNYFNLHFNKPISPSDLGKHH